MDKNEEIARSAIEGLKTKQSVEKDRLFEKILEILKIPKNMYIKRIKNET